MHRVSSLCVVILCLLSPVAHAQGSLYCPADLVNDNTLDFFDVAEFLEAFNEQDPAVDFTNDGIFNFFDVADFLDLYFAGCPDMTDTDGDRIPDFAETNTGIYIDLFNTGSDPLRPDTDGDGLDDGDEVLGTIDGLILTDANPTMKDIYVECDWFAGNFQGRSEDYRPTTQAVERIVECFYNASTPNPYGNPDGIAIHLDYGQGEGFTGGNQIPGQPTFIKFDDEFNAYKAKNFDPRRKGYFHYVLFANRYNSSSNQSSGIAEIDGDDFMVTLSDYQSTNTIAGAFTHELGHNLGLRHGGFENRNRKPNYNSVMNYRHTFPGVDVTGTAIGNGVLDYSRGTNVDLDEGSLLELDGVDGSTPIDWNRNGQIESGPYAANINCNNITTVQECGVGTSCYDDDCTVLKDNDDWNNIVWGRLQMSFDIGSVIEISACDNWPGK